MSNPLLTTPHSKVDSRVKEPSGVGTTSDCFSFAYLKSVLLVSI